MAQKEIAIKVKIEGQEISMAGKQLDNFKKTIESLKKQLELLGARTEENGEQFDKLKGDLDALNAAFGETNEELKETNENLEDNDEQVQKNEKTTKSYAAQIRQLRTELISLGDRTEENAAQYDSLVSKIQDLSEKQEDLQFGTKKLDDALSALPGPIGKVAGGFKNLEDTWKNGKTALKGLTNQFPILKNAIAATGIGLLVIIIGSLVAAVMRAYNTFKPLQEAVGKLGIVFDLVGKSIQPVIDLIGKGLTGAVEGFAGALAFFTRKKKEYDEAIADNKSSEFFIKFIKNQIEGLNKERLTADEYRKKEIDNITEYYNKVIELNEKYNNKENNFLVERAEHHKQLTDEEKEQYVKYKVELSKINEEFQIKENELVDIYTDEYIKLLSEKNLLILKTQKEKDLLSLKQQKIAQDESIKELAISEEQKQKLLELNGQIYLLKQKEINKKYADEQKQAEKDLTKTIRDIRISAIEDEKKRSDEEASARRDDALEKLEDLKKIVKDEQLIADYTLAIWEKYYADLDKLQKDHNDKNLELLYKQIEFERQSRQIGFDNQLKMIDIFSKTNVEKVQQRQIVLDEQAKETYEKESQNLTKLLSSKEITQQEFNERSKELNTQYNLAIIENELQTQEQIVEAKMEMVNTLAGVASSLGGFLNEIAGKNKKLAIAAIIVEKASAIAQVVANTAIANAKAVAAFPLTSGQPWVTINKIAAGLSIASLVAASVKSIKEINSGGSSDSSGSGGTSKANYGKNYASGGEIKGKRHAQGGTVIEAEDGEAIMTRGAVSMFKPMLSLMNQMGGGVSFDARIVKPDNPITKQPSQEPIILKTYVVESELSSEQNKQARLKNLSTI